MDLGNLVEISERRGCTVCGKEFRSERGGRSALQQLSEHLSEHQPTLGQWSVAYERIRARMPKRQKGTSGE